MASEAQRKRDVLAAVRRARNQQRTLDTAIERLERELLRLRNRKTLIQADDLVKAVSLWDEGVRKGFDNSQRAMNDLVQIASL